MKNIVNKYIDQFQKKHRHYRRYCLFIGVLALITIFGVNWGLHQNGISMSNSMSDKITSMTGSGTTYDADGNLYSTDLKIDFYFPTGEVTEDKLDYYYDYPEGIIIPDGLLNTPKDLYDGNSKKAGTYTFVKTEDGKYRVNVNFDSNYVKNNTESIIGYIQFSGQVDGSKGDDDGNIKIIGSDKVTLDIPKNEITYPDDETNRYEIKTHKEGSFEKKDGKLVYTVYVYSLKGTPGDINFEDVINASNLTLGNPNITVTKQTVKRYYSSTDGSYDASYKGGTVTNEAELNVDSTYDNGKISMTLPKIEPAEHNEATANEVKNDVFTRYKIEYTYDVDLSDDVDLTVKNKVDTVSKNTATKVEANDETEVDIKNSNEITLEKEGTPDINVDQIVWSITINKNEADIAGAELTDPMLIKHLKDHLSIAPQNGFEYIKDENGNITGIKFIATENGENHNTYTIRYRTPLQGSWNTSDVSNTATLTPSGGSGITDTGTVTVDGPIVKKTVESSKESDDGKTVEVNWKVRITAPTDKIPQNAVIEDTLENTNEKPQYFTRQQVIDWSNNIYWVDVDGNKLENLDLIGQNLADVTFVGSDGNTYTWQEINESSNNDLTYTGCKVTLKQDLTPPTNALYLIFEYKTTADISNTTTGKNNYVNKVTVDNKEANATYTYNKSGISKTDENNVTDTTQKTNEDGTLTWKIKVNTSKNANKLTITDNLPESVKLIDLSGEDNLSSFKFTIDEEEVTGTGDYKATGTYKDGKLTVNIVPKDNGKDLTPGQYTLVVTCKVDTDSIKDYEAGKTYTFKNSANAKEDNKEIGSSDQTQEWTEDTEHSNTKIVDKTGKWDNNSRRVKYSIKLNPYGKDIVEDSEILTLKDVFNYFSKIYYKGDTNQSYDLNAWLVPDSVKLYKGVMDSKGELTKGEEITNWQWTVETSQNDYPEFDGGYKMHSTLTGTNLPDSTPMILEYEYQLESDVPSDKQDDWTSLSFNNDAELLGTAYKDGQTLNNITWNKQDTAGAVTSDLKGTLYKVSKGNYGKTLPGATFKLQKYNGTDYVDTGVTYITDENGKIDIQWQKSDSDIQYEYNTLYRVIETQAPDNYLLPSNPEENAFYFYFSGNDTTNKLPDPIPATAVDLAKKSSTFYVENESTRTDITINKQWLNVDGVVDTGHTGSIRFELYRKESKTSSSSNKAVLKGEIRQGDITWTTVWKNFEEKEYPAGTEISFTITCLNDWITNKQPDMKVNNIDITPVIGQNANGKATYTYTFTLSGGENTILGAVKDTWTPDSDYELSEVTAKEPSTSDSEATETLYGTYDISSADGWTKTISDLPTQETINGETVYYTYYVKEVGNNNYDISYDNNEGITSGTITIKNKMSENPSYTLPGTGSIGELACILVGSLMMIVAVIYGSYLKIKKVTK